MMLRLLLLANVTFLGLVAATACWKAAYLRTAAAIAQGLGVAVVCLALVGTFVRADAATYLEGDIKASIVLLAGWLAFVLGYVLEAFSRGARRP